MVLVGYICSTRVGWPTSFYVYGGLGYCWALLWFFFGANSPAEHKSISQEERSYIENSLEMREEVKVEKSFIACYFPRVLK